MLLRTRLDKLRAAPEQDQEPDRCLPVEPGLLEDISDLFTPERIAELPPGVAAIRACVAGSKLAPLRPVDR